MFPVITVNSREELDALLGGTKRDSGGEGSDMKKIYATYSYEDIHTSEDECHLVLKFETEEDRDMIIEAIEDPE